MEIPREPVNFVPAKAGEIVRIGDLTMRILEDGSRSSDRLGVVEFILPPNFGGPIPHWHEMHDEGFYVNKGTVRFHIPDVDNLESGKDASTIDANVGDFVMVPVRAPHSFTNPLNEESRFINTYTPSYYVQYFKLMESIMEKTGAKGLTPEINAQAMQHFATIPLVMPGEGQILPRK